MLHEKELQKVKEAVKRVINSLEYFGTDGEQHMFTSGPGSITVLVKISDDFLEVLLELETAISKLSGNFLEIFLALNFLKVSQCIPSSRNFSRIMVSK